MNYSLKSRDTSTFKNSNPEYQGSFQKSDFGEYIETPVPMMNRWIMLDDIHVHANLKYLCVTPSLPESHVWNHRKYGAGVQFRAVELKKLVVWRSLAMPPSLNI